MIVNKTRMSFLIIFFYFLNNAFAQSFDSRNHYLGTIGPGNKVYMDLRIKENNITGYYFYYKKGIPIGLEGKIESDKNYKINEHTGEKQTGIFTGTFDNLNKLTGQWSNPAGNKKFQYELNLIAHGCEFKSDTYDISVEYPQFSIADRQNCQRLNDTIKTIAYNLYKNFLQNINDFISPETAPPFFYVEYNIQYFSDEIISLFFTYSEYTGGVHPNTYYSTFNILLTDNKITEIELNDLFMKDSNYLKILSDICRTKLKNQGASFVVDGEIQDFSDILNVFSLTPQNLIFTFAPYLVGPYVEGTYTVEIPYKDIKSIIDPTGPIGKIDRF